MSCYALACVSKAIWHFVAMKNAGTLVIEHHVFIMQWLRVSAYMVEVEV